MHGYPVRFRANGLCGQYRREQAGFKRGFIQSDRQRVANARFTGAAQILADGGRRRANGVGNLSTGTVAFVMQPQCFCNLAHG